MKNERQKDESDLQDKFGEIPFAIARFCFWAGIIVFGLSLAAVVLMLQRTTGDPNLARQTADNVGLFQKGMQFGVVFLALGSAYIFWEEEVMVFLNLAVAGLLYFSPAIVPMVFSNLSNNSGADACIAALQSAGGLYGVMALIILVGDISIRVRNRAVHGTKADQLKYGKGIKEESDRQNVFLGKCWQLPYCRKFVRERCPIYHTKRTCWKELVGCMCEEKVIQTAMSGKVISKEALANPANIPHNHKLTFIQKRERCKNCVIYNEHQKHKYRALIPVVLVSYGLIFALMREPLAQVVNRMLGLAGQAVKSATVGAVQNVQTGEWFIQFLVFCIILVAMTYTLKLVEYAVFKLKI